MQVGGATPPSHAPCKKAWHVALLIVMEGALLGGLVEAAHFAAGKHRDQRRKDAHGTPYINHPLGVAYLLWKEGGVTDLATLQVN